jgi:hypothetical protein
MEHVEVRLDTRTKRRLEEWAQCKNISLAEAVRRIVQERLGLPRLAQSKADAARQILGVGLTDVPGSERLEDEIHDAFAQ